MQLFHYMSNWVMILNYVITNRILTCLTRKKNRSSNLIRTNNRNAQMNIYMCAKVIQLNNNSKDESTIIMCWWYVCSISERKTKPQKNIVSLLPCANVTSVRLKIYLLEVSSSQHLVILLLTLIAYVRLL